LAGHGGTDCQSEGASFGNWGIDNPLLAEFGVQSIGLFENTAGRADILTDQNHALISPHLAG
jgi:hypothetical protein